MTNEAAKSSSTFMKRIPHERLTFYLAKFENTLLKSERFAVSLRKKKKESKIKELRAKRILI
jgi:hypothetical protein